ncbi:universal stress protein PHOS32-like [Juglans microcarpa x Juglans regia]|uniref:universal stress protein PHOS32-like n=1 Tax=Juglans microcarpa x Juglans regia TaxID=2249226 RepID=UPI001B7E9E0B|nr:universal stress protein PHOS32-like [Juglans microcarpa x Juglans regia]
MAKAGTKLPSFCLKRIRPHARVRSPPVQSKPGNVMSSNKSDKKSENPGTVQEEKSGDHGVKPGLVISRRIMVVVDSSLEAKGALQWALSHTVQIEDTVILLCVTRPSKQGTCSQGSIKKIVPRSYEFIDSLKKLCQSKKPEVKLEVAVVERKEKGPAIVEEARKQGVSMLVLGQKKRSTTLRLMMMWAGKRVTGGVVEYCIHNADCLAIAVRRKSKKLGGYLITTKRQKDFWLLA